MEGDACEGAVVCVSRKEMIQALNEIKTRKVQGYSDVSLELIAASWGVGIHVMADMSESPRSAAELAVGIVVPIFKGKGDIRNCSCYEAVKLLEYSMKVVERVLDKWLCRIVSVDEMQFGFMPERGTNNAIFILRRMEEEYHAKGKKVVCVFCGLRESFRQSTKESIGMGLEEEGNNRCFG